MNIQLEKFGYDGDHFSQQYLVFHEGFQRSSSQDQSLIDSSKIWVPSNPRGAEMLPPGIVEAESDLVRVSLFQGTELMQQTERLLNLLQLLIELVKAWLNVYDDTSKGLCYEINLL
ncbi:hypothetical protein K1719_032441 [Acacia pycnantha]|nr:hypothetical protein K1719_032441 [Acacia pycnantha]